MYRLPTFGNLHMSRTIDTDSAAMRLAQPIRVGRLELANRMFLAPLAGVSDVPFRRICQEMGAGSHPWKCCPLQPYSATRVVRPRCLLGMKMSPLWGFR